MTMLKSLLLGSAAGLVAVAGAQAADLPAKAKAVEYVKVCDAYGAGFYYIPGTDTCLKVGGAIRVDYYVNSHSAYSPSYGGQGSLLGYTNYSSGNMSFNRTDDITSTRARFIVDMDARSRTEYGTLRSYGRFYITNDSTGTGANFGSYSSSGTGRIAVTDFERAFIQFAGFTFGYVQSFYDYSNGLGTFWGTHINSNRWATALAYTASFGNGLSATLSFEDPSARRGNLQVGAATAATYTAATGIATLTDGASAWAGIGMPDVIGVLRVDQSWGSAQVSGVIHQLRSTWSNIAGGFNKTDYGWAIQGGMTFNLDMIAKGDQFMIEAAYGDGATDFVGFSPSPYAAKGALGLIKGASGAILDYADGYLVGGRIETPTAWSVRADYRHFWTPSLRSTVFGGYASYELPSAITQTAVAQDFNVWQVGFNTTWSPVKNLDLGLEVVYVNIDPSKSYAAGASTNAGYATSSIDAWSGMLRAQRNF